MSKTKDLGHLAHIVTYDGSNHITVPAGITMHTNQLVASQSWVTTELGSYALSTSLGSYVPTSRTITINGTSYDLSANRSWDITSMIYPAVGIPLSTGSAWGTSITNNSANWNTAYGWGNHASAGYALSSHNHNGTYWPVEGAWKPASLASSTRLIGKTSPDGGEFALAYSGGQIHAYTDGFFYQNEGQYRVLDTNSYSSYALPLSGGVLTGNTYVNGGYSFISNGANNNGGFAMNNSGTYWGLMWNYGNNDWRLGRGSVTAQNGWNLRWDSGDNVFINQHLYLNNNYGSTIVGAYSASRYQGVFAMGDAYKLPLDGTSPGSLYGLAWSHPNAGGQAGYLNDHGLLVMVNGVTYAAISSNIWARGNVTANGYVYANGSMRLGDMWEGGGIYRSSGNLVFGTEGAGYKFMVSGTQRCYIGTDGNIWMQWLGDYISNRIGQDVRNGASVTFGDVYSNAWFRNYGDSGLYNQDYGCHFRRSSTATHGTWEMFGYNKNGYGGLNIIDPQGYWNNIMFENGSGGIYVQNGNGWSFYYSRNNNCCALGGSSTNGWSRCSTNGTHHVAGDLYADGAVTAYSDGRAKENVSTIENALDKVLKMRGVAYNMIDDATKFRTVGFIAQEINEVVPEVVKYIKEADRYNVAYGNVSAVLVEAIKEQQTEIKEQDKKIEELTNMVSLLQETIQTLLNK